MDGTVLEGDAVDSPTADDKDGATELGKLSLVTLEMIEVALSIAEVIETMLDNAELVITADDEAVLDAKLTPGVDMDTTKDVISGVELIITAHAPYCGLQPSPQ